MFTRIILKIVLIYQKIISPNLQKNCRFWPSCSEYFYISVAKYGAVKGSLKGIRRILKCYPCHAGGVDLP